jgi:hypothetical protein
MTTLREAQISYDNRQPPADTCYEDLRACDREACRDRVDIVTGLECQECNGPMPRGRCEKCNNPNN